jgi:hypothetical protein
MVGSPVKQLEPILLEGLPGLTKFPLFPCWTFILVDQIVVLFIDSKLRRLLGKDKDVLGSLIVNGQIVFVWDVVGGRGIGRSSHSVWQHHCNASFAVGSSTNLLCEPSRPAITQRGFTRKCANDRLLDLALLWLPIDQLGNWVTFKGGGSLRTQKAMQRQTSANLYEPGSRVRVGVQILIRQ